MAVHCPEKDGAYAGPRDRSEVTHVLKPWGHLAWNTLLAVQLLRVVRWPLLLLAHTGLRWVLVSGGGV